MRLSPIWSDFPVAILALAASLLFITGCESTHETYQGDAPADTAAGDTTTDVPSEVGTDTEELADQLADQESDADIALASCGAEEGVTVSGTISFGGEVPGSARLWIIWMVEIGLPGMPPCFEEITPIRFPVDFEVRGVPLDADWCLVILLDADGRFPPLPAAEDFWACIPKDQLDLSADVTGLVLDLEPYEQQ
ncbi:MAG: hypothetical protein JW797_18595 [Bradymonadales bacterium]|nr:hypothetical protein [Bradymonadales bacterium]